MTPSAELLAERLSEAHADPRSCVRWQRIFYLLREMFDLPGIGTKYGEWSPDGISRTEALRRLVDGE